MKRHCRTTEMDERPLLCPCIMTSSPDLSSPALTLQLQPYELHLLAWTPCDAMPLADIFPTQLPGGGKAFHSITVTEEEVSVLAERKEAERLLRLLEEKRVEMLGESSVWRALKVKGPLDLSLCVSTSLSTLCMPF